MRAALGAGRGDIVRNLITESVLLACAGGAAGILLAWAGLRLAIAMRPANLPRVDEAGLDITVLAATAVVSILTGLAFGLVPAWQLARPDVAGVLKDGGRSGTAGRQVARRGLVVLQMA